MDKNKLTFMVFLNLIIALALCFAFPYSAKAQSGTPAGVLAEINAYRANNGLSPLAENQYLNIAAQNHVNWMATTGNYSHTGEGGSTYTDRALAVGYGEGQGVRVTENWARGHQMTPYEVVHEMWKPSGVHNSQMLTTSYNEFGAGVALDGDGMTVYVVVFGIVNGSSLPDDSPAQPTATTAGPTSTPVPLSHTITTATPNPDGSVQHVVQYGQPPAAIAEAYEINLDDLLALNNLTEDSVIYPDQELLILAPSIPTATPTDAIATPEKTLDPTPNASQTPTDPVQPTPTQIDPIATQPPQRKGNILINIFSGDTLWIGIGLVSLSVFGLGLLLYTSSRLQ